MYTTSLSRVAAADSGRAVSRADVLYARRDTRTGAGDRRAARSAFVSHVFFEHDYCVFPIYVLLLGSSLSRCNLY